MPSDILTPMPDDQIGRLALIEAMRANTDALQRVGRQVEGQEKKFDEIGKTLGEMKTDIALLKNNALKDQVERNTKDIEKIEAWMGGVNAAEAQRRGERGAVAAFFNSKAIPWALLVAGGLAAWVKGLFQ